MSRIRQGVHVKKKKGRKRKKSSWFPTPLAGVLKRGDSLQLVCLQNGEKNNKFEPKFRSTPLQLQVCTPFRS